MTFLEQCITPEPVQQRFSPEVEEIIYEIVKDPLNCVLGALALTAAMFGMIFLFAAAGAAQ